MRAARKLPSSTCVGDARGAAARPEDSLLASAYRQHAPYLGRLATRLLGRREDADDLVQDVFLIAAEKLDLMRSEFEVRQWLATVTARGAARRLRLRRLRATFGMEPAVLETLEHIAPDAGPETMADIGRLFAILDRVAAADRVAWTLRYVEGERLESVATLCGCSLATAKRRIARAHETVLRALEAR